MRHAPDVEFSSEVIEPDPLAAFGYLPSDGLRTPNDRKAIVQSKLIGTRALTKDASSLSDIRSVLGTGASLVRPKTKLASRDQFSTERVRLHDVCLCLLVRLGISLCHVDNAHQELPRHRSLVSLLRPQPAPVCEFLRHGVVCVDILCHVVAPFRRKLNSARYAPPPR